MSKYIYEKKVIFCECCIFSTMIPTYPSSIVDGNNYPVTPTNPEPENSSMRLFCGKYLCQVNVNDFCSRGRRKR